MAQVTIFVVGYNNPAMEGHTLACTAQNTNMDGVELRYVQNIPGKGLAKCWNDLIRDCNSQFVCLLNPDTIPAKGWLAKMRQILENSPEIAAVVPSSNSVFISQVDTPGLNNTNVTMEKVEATARRMGTAGEYLKTASAMCVLFRRDVWEELGGFDERFFLYGEDTEFFRRVTKAGHKILWRHDAFVYHYKAQCIGKAVDDGELDQETVRSTSEDLLRQLTDLDIRHKTVVL